MKPLPQKTPRRTAATRRPQLTLISSATFLVLGVLHGGAAADDLRLPAANVYAGANPPVSGERLSDWLQRQPAVDDAYFPGLSWLVPAEVPAQTALKNALQAHLLGSEWTFRADVQARQRLSAWIGTLPVTGRVPIPVADSRWLEVHPAQNPVLAPDHQVRVPPRPTTVTVVTGDGYLCAVPHAAGHDARAYIEACRSPQDTRPVDRVWMAQPDGQVQSFGIGGWNAQKQGEPAPGAWLWAPARGAGWSDGFAKKLMAFLATQGPSAAQAAASTAPADDTARLPTSPLPSSPQTPLRDPVITGNDWGGIGLLQNPSARMAPAGELSTSFTRAYPYSRLNVTLQPLDWLELTYRYASISGVPYGPRNLSGDQSYKDKSVDLKLRLLKESAQLPEISLGARDVGGTGLFSGEYLVASKRVGDYDWSLGLGWGSLGSKGSLGNPLSFISKKFNTRGASATASGGQLGFKSFFRGRTSLFGGVQVQTGWDPLILKLEYDASNYRFNNRLFAIDPPRSSFNVAAVYRYSPSIDLTLGVQRGNVATLGLNFHYPLARLSTPKTNDPAPLRFVAQRPATGTWSTTGEDLSAHTGWQVTKIQQQGKVLRVEFDNADEVYWREKVDRATAVLHRDAPAEVEEFHFIYKNRGMALADHVVDRELWAAPKARPIPPSELVAQADTRAIAPASRDPAPVAEPSVNVFRASAPRLSSDFGFALKQSLGGPNGFILYQLSLEGRSEYRLSPSTWASGTVNLRAFDNYNRFKYTADSNLPRVRTFIREYLTTSRVTMPNLQLTHVGQLSTNQFYSLYGGYLESMYAGVGGEWLYRPFAGPLALGLDVNAVKQRDFDQKLGLRDYRALTGHLTAYIETGWNDVLAAVSVGQYLAKDRGVTLDLSRRFSNGVVFGAFATKTNVSAARFGEGSFDKGIYFSIPLSAMFAKSTPDRATFVWNPLTRDGGAKLHRAYPLYSVTTVRNPSTLRIEPPTGP